MQRYFYLGPDLALAQLEDGHFVYVDPLDETVAHHLIASGRWETWIGAALRRLIRPGDRVVEVGANFGAHSVAMARAVGPTGRLICLEANPRLAPLVERSLVFNGYADRAEVVAAAAGNAARPVTMITSRRNAGGGALSEDPAGLGPGGELMTVPGVRLDDLVEGAVDLIRMDAEGSEPLILAGARRLLSSPAIVVMLEWDVVQMGARAVVADFVGELRDQGFGFWKVEHDAALTPVAAEAMATLSGHEVVLSRQAPQGAG